MSCERNNFWKRRERLLSRLPEGHLAWLLSHVSPTSATLYRSYGSEFREPRSSYGMATKSLRFRHARIDSCRSSREGADSHRRITTRMPSGAVFQASTLTPCSRSSKLNEATLID